MTRDGAVQESQVVSRDSVAETVTIPPIVSVDDHVIEPPDLWERWLPSKYREVGPKVVRSPYEVIPGYGGLFRTASDGPETDFWVYEGEAVAINTGFAASGLDAEHIDERPVAYRDMRPGFYRPADRLADMDLNHIERSVCFPTFPRFCGQTFLEAQDKEVALAGVRAYNEWMVEEWTGDSGGRLIPLCLIPLWDVEEAVREVERNAVKGVRAVAFSELPARLGLPSIHDGYWDPLFGACAETGTVVCMHIGSSSQLVRPSKDAPIAVVVALTSTNAQISMADWLLSGVLARFPRLKLAYSEGQIGWMPYLLERCDSVWRRQNRSHNVPAELVEPPSSYVAGRVYGCFFEDSFGLRSRADIGIDIITFESDYPHQDSTWPNTRAWAETAMADLSPQEIYKVVRGNAIDLFGLPEELSAVD